MVCGEKSRDLDSYQPLKSLALSQVAQQLQTASADGPRNKTNGPGQTRQLGRDGQCRNGASFVLPAGAQCAEAEF
jgi:hypothetical protein